MNHFLLLFHFFGFDVKFYRWIYSWYRLSDFKVDIVFAKHNTMLSTHILPRIDLLDEAKTAEKFNLI